MMTYYRSHCCKFSVVYVCQNIITSARRYCDPSCLFVGWFVRSLTSGTGDAGGRAVGTVRVCIVVVRTAMTGGLAEVALYEHFF